MKILIIRFSSIGDIVLTSPVIRAIKMQLENAEVHFCTKKNFHSILDNNPYVDKIHLLDDSLLKLVYELRREKYDYIIDLHANLRSSLIKSFLFQVKSYTFDKINREKWLYVNFKINKMPNRHIVDRYMDTVLPLGVRKDAFGLDYFIPEKDEVEQAWLPETHQKEFVAFVIGGQHATKKLPVNRIIELCDKINKPIILLGGKEDVEIANHIESFFMRHDDQQIVEEKVMEMNKKTIIYNACGKFNLNQSASILKMAKYVFTHDTGLMHIAAAFKKHIYSIWGNTTPHFGMYPYKTKFVVLENNKLACRPCSKIGFDKCPKGHFDCMNKIVFDFWLP